MKYQTIKFVYSIVAICRSTLKIFKSVSTRNIDLEFRIQRLTSTKDSPQTPTTSRWVFNVNNIKQNFWKQGAQEFQILSILVIIRMLAAFIHYLEQLH